MESLIGRTYAGYADWRSFDTREIAHVLNCGRWIPAGVVGGQDFVLMEPRL